jgi:signal transduction histidine kinase/DNA-binding response OmpR family regulator/HPt (histidine-containing phosphotransfer) domain-containing protein
MSEFALYSEIIIIGLIVLCASLLLIILVQRTAVKNANAALAEDAFASLLQTTPNMMLIVDDMRKVSYISKNMSEFADCPAEYAVGRPALDLFRDFEIKLMFADIIESEGFFEDVRKINVNGRARHFKIVCDRLQGMNEGMFIDVADVTATVEAKLEAEHEKENAVLANVSKSKFLATMSHEIRTPMNAIIGISQMHIGHDDMDSDTVDAFDKIYTAGYGLLAIINDILDFSKIETGKLEIIAAEYDLPSLINDTVTLYLPRIGSKPIVFELEIGDGIPEKLLGDDLRIKQILGNILTNAFKYTEKGTVKMSVSAVKTEDGINLIISVKDTGQGMKPEDIKTLGNDFARFNLEANRSTEGTGLGISITKRLLGLMNGNMDIQSEYRVGSTFTVFIPQKAATDKTIGKELIEKLQNFSYSPGKQSAKIQIDREYMPYGKVLVVDDVETNLYVAVGLLRPYGINAKTASSGFEAIDIVSAGEVFDIIFMDHMMPRMDGIETTEKLRSAGYSAPIVALTANAITGNEAMFREKGFDDFISKPIDIRRLNTVLERFVYSNEKEDAYKREAGMPPRASRAQSLIETPKSLRADFKNTLGEKSVESAKEKIVMPNLYEAFVRDVKKAIVILIDLGKSDVKLFTTTAHAMKSACANVGNNELSELAKTLEMAGRAGDIKYIELRTPEFVVKLKAFTDEISSKYKTETLTEDKELLEKNLREIAAACESFDSKKANKLFSELRDKKWTDETETLLGEISAHLLHAEFEEAEKLAEKFSRMKTIETL